MSGCPPTLSNPGHRHASRAAARRGAAAGARLRMEDGADKPAQIAGGPSFIEPDWPRHPRVRAVVSTRNGGFSKGAFNSLNVATHEGDSPAAVDANRQRLCQMLELPTEPVWLEQVHGTRVVQLADIRAEQPPEADAAWTSQTGVVCAVMSADCLPVLFADRSGRHVAASHAGWRGLAAGVLEQTVRSLPVPAAQITAWLGPAIGPSAYEVGAEVRAQFLSAHQDADDAFRRRANGKFELDMYSAARLILRKLGVSDVHGGTHCTFTESDTFFSFRRDGRCGRMVSLIWLE